jgi:hypothetical protein
MPLVILTYPGHFLLTALTIKSYLKYHKTPEQVILVVDDISDKVWPTYVADCYELYSTLVSNIRIQPASQIPAAHQFNFGWIRQQIIKLYLDLIIDAESWFFTDGDIVFLHPVEPNDLPYSLPYSLLGPIDRQNSYIRKVLGIEQAGIFVNGKQVCVNDPAFRTMYRQTLIDLRNHVEQVHSKSISHLHLNYQNKLSIRVSEWELLESFRLYVQGQQPCLVRYAPHNLMNIPDDLTYFTHQFLTCYNADKDFGRDWFSDQGVLVSDRIWQILSNINR